MNMSMVFSILILLAVGGLGFLVWQLRAMIKRSFEESQNFSEIEKRLVDEVHRLRSSIDTGLRDQQAQLNSALQGSSMNLVTRVHDSQNALTVMLTEKFQLLQNSLLEQLHGARRDQSDRLEQLRQDNAQKLEQIRETVDEKLHATLENRLGESFKLVSERLELVHKGLGEMRELATGVGDLKRVLTNVKTRGIFGEIQLGSLLEEVLTPAQFERDVATVPGSSERVEFAVKLPGKDLDGGSVFLPIDSKFPQEDYLRLMDAYEQGNAVGIEEARSALKDCILKEAAQIKKYISPPKTTDFGLMFVPTEGLYAEIIRIPGILETLQKKFHVNLVGPTTLYSVLNSLQMGFKTLAIEKRSSEVWKVLAAVKTEFGKFGESLSAVSRKLQEASNKIDESARRSRAVERSLREVEVLPELESTQVLKLDLGRDSTELES